MSWLPDIFSSDAAVAPGEVQANYDKLKVQYAAHLKNRLANGEISESFYNNQLSAIRDGLNDPGDVAWSGFLADVESEAKNLPANIQTVVGDTAQWIGNTTGKIASNASGGFFKGLVSNGWAVGGWIVLAIALFFVWKPLMKILKYI